MAVPSSTMPRKMAQIALFSALLRCDSVPSGFMTASPSAQAIGHQVKTLQPPQSPPKKVPWMSPPSFATARASAANSASDFGGFSGSRPASLNSFLLYIQTERSTTNGRPYFLPSQIEALMGPCAMSAAKGRVATRAVRSWNSPAEVQLGINTTSAENTSGSEPAAAAAPTFV